MASQLTTKSLFGRKVVSSKGKKIGKVRRFVFHPSEKRVVGFTVKRPDAALMFHRKDLFVALDGFDIDDDNFKELFEDQKTNEIIRVRAKCREEAIYCIINELWRSDEKRAIFVVKTLEDWDKLSQSASTGNIYIPWFWAEEICAIENNTNIFIYTEGVPSFSHDEIQLRPRTFRTISNALVKAGIGINDADNLVRETHGLYIPMKRKIFNGQYLKKPEWIDGLSDNIKKTALLIGQWTDLEGDKLVVTCLSGMAYDDFVDAINITSQNGCYSRKYSNICVF